jgi:hypothetical protein
MKLFKNFDTIDFNVYDEIVTLGTCCHPTFFIRDYNLSKGKKSYPFDWISTDSIEDIIKVLNNDFKDFIELSNRRLDPTYNYEALTTTNYRFVIPHHTSEKFKSLYPNKIKNLMDLYNSTKHVLFILECHPYSKCTELNAKEIVEILKQKAPNCNINLLIINEFSDNDSLFELSYYTI